MDLNKKIISYMLFYSECIVKCSNSLEESYFDKPYNKLFSSIVSYYRSSKKILTTNIVKHLLEKRSIDSERITFYIRLMDELVNEKPDVNEFEYFLKEFKESYVEKVQRKFLGENEEDKESILSLLAEQKNPIKAYERMKEAVVKVEQILKADKEREGPTLKSVDEQKEQYLIAEASPKDVKGVLTGFKDIDEATNGLADDLFVIVGGISEGKSFLLLTIAKNMWLYEHSILYFTLELSKEKIDRRFTATLGGLDTRKIKSGILDEAEKKRYFKALEKQKERKNLMYVVDLPRNTTPLTLESSFLKVRDLVKPSAIFIDYLNLLKPNSASSQDARDQGQVSSELHELVRQYKIPILTAAQATSKRHQVARQFEIGYHRIGRAEEIGANADIILQINKPDGAEYSKQLDFHLTKVREGPQKEFQVYCDWASATIIQGDPYQLMDENELKEKADQSEKN